MLAGKTVTGRNNVAWGANGKRWEATASEAPGWRRSPSRQLPNHVSTCEFLSREGSRMGGAERHTPASEQGPCRRANLPVTAVALWELCPTCVH